MPSVTKAAVVQRINRKLLPKEQQLKKTRGRYMQSQFGDYYILDLRHNSPIQSHMVVTNCARDLNVLAPWETVED